ncbi:DUF1993 domain-containing protein [Mesorhizobium sp. VK23B]|uniref:DUF1993 domain-containing protein n=1 Tax=Mesorhizobium dulcispinae TaxID=3072316 RepID=A0ABU4XRJ6_9HYPH|nr:MULTISPECIES: DUF1993 domain-containing protein [unclassified Mesorhizobium]MDX8470282.1 DUF1993 domain-containing protein [Mesorhizobium sp. VK23B]MDX8476663.1 DUF1993 domain-containing protein [Mesorhizobium sp. VK23A]
MTISMYEVTIPTLNRGLTVLDGYLDEAARYASEQEIDPSVLIQARLYTDMMPFSSQIQRASDTAKAAMHRLLGAKVPSFPDTEKSLDELKQRLAKTKKFLNSFSADSFEGSDERKVEMRFGPLQGSFAGKTYVLQFLLPNFYFHVTTAHDILRNRGVPVGKLDYLGALDLK